MTSGDEEMKDQESKRRTSAADKEDQDMDDPVSEHGHSTLGYGGQYGTATRPILNFRYPLGKIAKNPLRSYPSPLALYGMEPDGTLLDLPVFSTNFAAGRDSSRVFTRGDNDPATRALDAIGAARVPAESIEMCTWDAIQQTLEITRPFSQKDDIFHAYKLPERRAVLGATKHE